MSNKLHIHTKQKFSIRLFTWSAIIFVLGMLLLFNFYSSKTYGTSGMGFHGIKTIGSTNVILNEFTALTANATAGASSINVTSSTLNTNSRFSGNLQVGELILIIQMQGATIYSGNDSGYGSVSAYNNCGKYEFAEVSGVPNSTTINLYGSLKNSYTSTGKVQVVRVPRYSSFTVNSGASVTTDAWNGTSGGIFAVEVSNVSTINGTIDVSGKGFRGGRVDTRSNSGVSTFWKTTSDRDGSEKGESITGDWTVYGTLGGQYGRGAPANGGGGGGTHNCGGGGGANGGVVASWNGRGVPNVSTANYITAWNREYSGFSSNNSSGGGKGGYSCAQAAQDPIANGPNLGSWGCDIRQNNYGAGGRPLDNTGNRIFFGGGGGAGDQNDGSGVPGGAGGGIVFLIGGNTVSGSSTINANGSDAANTIGPGGADGGSGGGGGGTIIIYTTGSAISNLTMNAKGGKGGNQDNTTWPSESEGPGGGGGGGNIQTTNSNSLTIATSGGLEGTTNSTSLTAFPMNGATRGNGGNIGNSILNPYSSYSPLPIKLKTFIAIPEGEIVMIKWVTGAEVNNSYFSLERSRDGESFYAIGDVAGSGSTSHDSYYEFVDKNPLVGNNYYRLRQTDYDGRTEIFPAKRVRISKKEKQLEILSVYPNPVNQFLKINFLTDENLPIDLVLLDGAGNIIYKERFIATAGVNEFQLTFDFSRLSDGIYFVYLDNGIIKTVVKKLIKH